MLGTSTIGIRPQAMFCQCMGHCRAVVWGNENHSSVATSGVEAEFMAASHVVKGVNWLQGFMQEIWAAPWRVQIFCDNQGCRVNLRNTLYAKYTKPVAVSFHYAWAP
eukprot:jgi/Botrbrau1/7656/Bobra.0159s0098.1